MSSGTTTRQPDGQVTVRPGRPRFGEAARPHLGWLYSLTRGLVGDHHTAEDLLRRCLREAHRTYGELDDVAALPALLQQSLVDCCRDHWRAQRRRPDEASLDAPDGPVGSAMWRSDDARPWSDPARAASLSDLDVDDVRAVLQRLDTADRIPLVLVHMGGCATAEVAALAEEPEETVLARLHRGRERFTQQLWAYADERGLLREASDRCQHPPADAKGAP